MIHKLKLSNFKRIENEVFEFTEFDLIVGSNNSGKSTVLQALAIWQYCIDDFKNRPRSRGSSGIQIVLPNFTALPLPEFNLLWSNRSSRAGKDFINIEIDVYWLEEDNEEKNFCVQLRYQSPQSVYATPVKGWTNFNELSSSPNFPFIVYVPPYSGLEPHEKRMDDGNIKQQIGKAQPGSVLRNLLYRVVDKPHLPLKKNKEWSEVHTKVIEWFGIDLKAPKYEKDISIEITTEYKYQNKTYDIISGGSGFHQILTLLSFVYGYPQVSTILFDEPDAHLHVNLQKSIINYFSSIKSKQFLIATHSEEFIKGVEVPSIISILSGKPSRIQNRHYILDALSIVDNIEVVKTQASPYILYLEGEDDERLLSEWAKTLNKVELYAKFNPYILSGGDKKTMKDRADKHFKALKQINTDVKQVILFDYDSDGEALNPSPNQYTLNEWKRKNIDNYLLIPDAWKRAFLETTSLNETDKLAVDILGEIDNFFIQQNLNLPPGATWKNLNAEIFKVLDGKKLLFSSKDSLFELVNSNLTTHQKINRQAVAMYMLPEEIHIDIENFFSNLEKKITS